MANLLNSGFERSRIKPNLTKKREKEESLTEKLLFLTQKAEQTGLLIALKRLAVYKTHHSTVVSLSVLHIVYPQCLFFIFSSDFTSLPVT